MKVLEAVEIDGSIQMIVHIDESQQVRDTQAALPEDGAEDTRAMVPDPAFVVEIQWGADVPIDVIKRETALLCEAERARRDPGIRKVVAALDGAVLTVQTAASAVSAGSNRTSRD